MLCQAGLLRRNADGSNRIMNLFVRLAFSSLFVFTNSLNALNHKLIVLRPLRGHHTHNKFNSKIKEDEKADRCPAPPNDIAHCRIVDVGPPKEAHDTNDERYGNHGRCQCPSVTTSTARKFYTAKTADLTFWRWLPRRSLPFIRKGPRHDVIALRTNREGLLHLACGGQKATVSTLDGPSKGDTTRGTPRQAAHVQERSCIAVTTEPMSHHLANSSPSLARHATSLVP